MNDIELADKIVACGVDVSFINHIDTDPGSTMNEIIPDPYKLVRDWRVAGAMMELVEANSKTSDTSWAFGKALAWFRDGQISLPRAINEACVEAI